MALQDITSKLDTRWEIDPENTTIQFAIGRRFHHQVQGRFSRVHGWAVTSGDDLGDAVTHIDIDASSIDTQLKVRDGHLRGDHFLGVDRFPTISFSSERVEDLGQNQLRIVGDLTIRGISRQVTLAATIERRDEERALLTATTTLDRRDYKIGPRLMGVTAGNDATVRISLALRAR